MDGPSFSLPTLPFFSTKISRSNCVSLKLPGEACFQEILVYNLQVSMLCKSSNLFHCTHLDSYDSYLQATSSTMSRRRSFRSRCCLLQQSQLVQIVLQPTFSSAQCVPDSCKSSSYLLLPTARTSISKILSFWQVFFVALQNCYPGLWKSMFCFRCF